MAAQGAVGQAESASMLHAQSRAAAVQRAAVEFDVYSVDRDVFIVAADEHGRPLGAAEHKVLNSYVPRAGDDQRVVVPGDDQWHPPRTDLAAVRAVAEARPTVRHGAFSLPLFAS